MILVLLQGAVVVELSTGLVVERFVEQMRQVFVGVDVLVVGQAEGLVEAIFGLLGHLHVPSVVKFLLLAEA